MLTIFGCQAVVFEGHWSGPQLAFVFSRSWFCFLGPFDFRQCESADCWFDHRDDGLDFTKTPRQPISQIKSVDCFDIIFLFSWVYLSKNWNFL